jgi:hypothetical protein
MADPSEWTNPSVLAFAEGDDPVEHASAAARQLLAAAAAYGLTAPPVDPLALAKLLGIATAPRDDVADASIAVDPRDTGTHAAAAPLRDLVRSDTPLFIAYNPNRPKGRLRFSIAHEIAHAIFPDVADVARHRTPVGALPDVSEGDEYELELLCNIVAAELLLPAEAVAGLLDIDTDIDFIMETRRRWDVSTEALLRRLVMSSHRQLSLVATSRLTLDNPGRLKVDYTAGSAHAQGPGNVAAATASLRRGRLIEPPNPFATCTAVGQTIRGTLTIGGTDCPTQAVGIPGYPGQLLPRVLGLVEPIGDQTNPQIRHESSDVLDFGDGDGPVVVAHVVNDSAHAWSRRGVAAALAVRYPQVARAFRAWTIAGPENLRLGNIHAIEQRDGGRTVLVVSMVAQQGFGPGAVTRLRYDALRATLTAVAELADRAGASVHVPRIGAGEAGGRWDLIENDLAAVIADRGIEVVVHTLPGGAQGQGSSR